MALRFYGKDGSENGGCPAVYVDEQDGSFIFVGWPIDDRGVIAEVETCNHVENGEAVFRVPRELRKAIWEACGGHDPDLD
jgi:hypothetical protein